MHSDSYELIWFEPKMSVVIMSQNSQSFWMKIGMLMKMWSDESHTNISSSIFKGKNRTYVIAATKLLCSYPF